jgi:hypothetical protein
MGGHKLLPHLVALAPKFPILPCRIPVIPGAGSQPFDGCANRVKAARDWGRGVESYAFEIAEPLRGGDRDCEKDQPNRKANDSRDEAEEQPVLSAS